MPVIVNVGNVTTVPVAPAEALPGRPGVLGGGVSDLPGWRSVAVGVVKVLSPVAAPPNAPLDEGNAGDRPGALNADTGARSATRGCSGADSRETGGEGESPCPYAAPLDSTTTMRSTPTLPKWLLS